MRPNIGLTRSIISNRPYMNKETTPFAIDTNERIKPAKYPHLYDRSTIPFATTMYPIDRKKLKNAVCNRSALHEPNNKPMPIRK